jgi:Family of unknown function (DUF6444)
VTAEPPGDGALEVLAEAQRVLIAGLETRNALLEEENAALRERLAELEDRLTALERVISRNSSMPPSSDDLSGKKPPAPRKGQQGGKRGPGKQPGAPGAHLAWAADPDKTVPLLLHDERTGFGQCDPGGTGRGDVPAGAPPADHPAARPPSRSRTPHHVRRSQP